MSLVRSRLKVDVIMPGLNPPSSERHGDTFCSLDNGNVEHGEEAMDPELLLDLIQHPFISSSCPLEDKMYRMDSSWNQDGDQLRCGPSWGFFAPLLCRLERKWVLWHEFMKEHAHLDAWLRLAEQALTTFNLANITYSTSKEELRKFERLRCEAGSQLIQLDSLTRRNRTLTRLFQGTMQARLLGSAQECGQRWDDVNSKLETIAGQLQASIYEFDLKQSVNPAPTLLSHRPSPPPPSPSHENMGLEWDPSVDIGRSVSHDDADSSYFSLCQREGTKRWSYLSSFDSRSDISADITNQEAALLHCTASALTAAFDTDWLDQTEPGLFSPVITSREEDQWNTSTPEEDANEPMKFDGGRVKAWLRVQSAAPSQNTASCSRAVQTDGDVKVGSLFSVSSAIQQDAGSEAGSNLALV
ncbi:hypothetical protein GOODEAATRI_009119 [Goodea atripinnis]|uniref:Uncharacterized protein n=1 Tax=Goodea atripinnis TaxID=208336 RepID=A0ABV0MGA4_9TELE